MQGIYFYVVEDERKMQEINFYGDEDVLYVNVFLVVLNYVWCWCTSAVDDEVTLH